MNFIQHPSNNAVMEAPLGAIVEECRALPVTCGEFSNGTPVKVSFWQPTDEEKAAIANNEPVYLSVIGPHPVVYIGVGSPLIED